MALADSGYNNSSALVTRSKVIAKANTSETISCESTGKPLSLCLWAARTVSDHREVIVIQKDATFPAAVRTDFGNVSTSSVDQLENGTCWLRIESMTEEHIGSWSCILVDQAGAVSTGQVKVFLERGEGV